MVHRQVLPEMRPLRVDYSLTELGHTIIAPLEAIRTWTEQHLPDVSEARERFAKSGASPSEPEAGRVDNPKVAHVAR